MASASSVFNLPFSSSSALSHRASDTLSAPYFAFYLENVAELIPCLRQTSAVAMPASCCFSIAMACSSLNLDRFIVCLLVGADSAKNWRKMQGLGHDFFSIFLYVPCR